MSSATDPLDTPHSDSDSERTLTASFPNYGDATSARSPDATLLVGTRRTATLATDGELFSGALQRSPDATILTDTRVTATPANDDELCYDALQRFFPHSFVADLSKHIFSLDNAAMDELAAILHVTVAPSITTQPARLHAYETAEAIQSSLLNRGIARSAIGGGVALIFPTEPSPSLGGPPFSAAAHDATVPISGSATSVPTFGAQSGFLLRHYNHPSAILGPAAKLQKLISRDPVAKLETPSAAEDLYHFLGSYGHRLREGAVVMDPPFVAAMQMGITVARYCPELVQGNIEHFTTTLYDACTDGVFPQFLEGSLLWEVTKELLRRLDEEFVGPLRAMASTLHPLLRERIKALDGRYVPNAARGYHGHVAFAFELRRYTHSLRPPDVDHPNAALSKYHVARHAPSAPMDRPGAEIQALERYLEDLAVTASQCTNCGVSVNMGNTIHEDICHFLSTMVFSDPFMKKALQQMTEEFAASPYRLHAPLEEQHNFATVTQYARSAVKKIGPMARQLRADSTRTTKSTSHVAALEAQIAQLTASQSSGSRAPNAHAKAAVAQSAPAALLPKDNHGLNFLARQKARGKCYNCGSKEHMVRDCDSDVQRCPLCLSTDHHCNQCPLLSNTAQQKNV